MGVPGSPGVRKATARRRRAARGRVDMMVV